MTPHRYVIAISTTSALVGAFVGAGVCYWIVGSQRATTLHRAELNPGNVLEREINAEPDEPDVAAAPLDEHIRKAHPEGFVELKPPVVLARKAEEQAEERKQKHNPEAQSLDSWCNDYDLEAGVMKQIGDVEVVLGYKLSTVYVPQNARNTFTNIGTFFLVGYRKPGELFADPSAGFIPVNGEAQKIKVVSSDSKLVYIHEDGSAHFRGPGQVAVTLRVAGESISVPITIVEFPITAGMDGEGLSTKASSAEDVVKRLGLPDDKTKHRISEATVIDCIFYRPNGTYPDANWPEHWKYKKYPGAVIAIVGNPGWVWSIGSSRTK